MIFLSRMLAITRGHRGLLSIAVVGSVLYTALSILPALIIRQMLTALAHQSPAATLVWLGLAMVGATALMAVSRYLEGGFGHIAAAVEEVVESGADRMIAIVLAPHYSTISTEGYRRRIAAALATARGRTTPNGSATPLSLDFVESWNELDGYLEAVAENVRRVRAEFAHPEDVVAVFTAHSLPARILMEGDPYQDQLLRTSELVARRAGIEQWRFSYQSQSQTGEPWLGPDLVDTVEELAAQGHRAILVASVGFIADHLEIFYDIDIEAKEKADALGIELRRTPMLNADPRLAQALHALVAQRVTAASAVPS